MTPHEGHRDTSDTHSWLVVGLAAFTQAINQIDKTVIGFAAEPIMEELSLSTGEYGLVAGSLYTFFALGGIAIGLFAAPRFKPRSIIIALLLIWSLSQLPIVLAASLSVLIVCRMLLGAAEGGGTGTLMNICHEWFPDHRRALPGALLLVGGTVGSMLAAPLLTYCIVHFGWRSAFLACSFIGLIAMSGWLLLKRSGPYAARPEPVPNRQGTIAALRTLLFTPTIVGNLAMGACAYWVVGFTVAWLAPYIRDQGEMSMESSGWILSLIFFGQSIIVVMVATLSQRLLAAGFSSRVGRAHVMTGCLLASALCFIGMAFTANPVLRILLVTFATSLPGAIFPLSSAMISEVAPAAERYRLMTIVLSLITLTALVSPGVAGSLIELGATHGWRPALLLMSSVSLIGALLGYRLLRSGAAQR